MTEDLTAQVARPLTIPGTPKCDPPSLCSGSRGHAILATASTNTSTLALSLAFNVENADGSTNASIHVLEQRIGLQQQGRCRRHPRIKCFGQMTKKCYSSNSVRRLDGPFLSCS